MTDKVLLPKPMPREDVRITCRRCGEELPGPHKGQCDYSYMRSGRIWCLPFDEVPRGVHS